MGSTANCRTVTKTMMTCTRFRADQELENRRVDRQEPVAASPENGGIRNELSKLGVPYMFLAKNRARRDSTNRVEAIYGLLMKKHCLHRKMSKMRPVYRFLATAHHLVWWMDSYDTLSMCRSCSRPSPPAGAVRAVCMRSIGSVSYPSSPSPQELVAEKEQRRASHVVPHRGTSQR